MNLVANVTNGVCWIGLYPVLGARGKEDSSAQHLHFHLQYDENLKRVVMEYDGAVIKKDLQAHTK